MIEAELPTPDRLLVLMHNFGVVQEKGSRSFHELIQMMKVSIERLHDILRTYMEAGYIGSFVDNEGAARYYLTRRGIIRVSSIFT